MLDTAIADVRKGGLVSVAAHTGDLEKTLANARPAFAFAESDPATLYVLIDGPVDTPTALMAASLGVTKKTPKAVFNPYPGIAFFLGTYYDAAGRPADGLRVLDAALALPYPERSEHRTDLLIERGAALEGLKRWKEALKSYDDALRIPGMAPGVQAYVQHRRADALATLGRKAEAAAAIRTADGLLADDERATRDYETVAKLKAGVPPAAKAAH